MRACSSILEFVCVLVLTCKACIHVYTHACTCTHACVSACVRVCLHDACTHVGVCARHVCMCVGACMCQQRGWQLLAGRSQETGRGEGGRGKKRGRGCGGSKEKGTHTRAHARTHMARNHSWQLHTTSTSMHTRPHMCNCARTAHDGATQGDMILHDVAQRSTQYGTVLCSARLSTRHTCTHA